MQMYFNAALAGAKIRKNTEYEHFLKKICVLNTFHRDLKK